jgi:hypothetical protein
VLQHLQRIVNHLGDWALAHYSDDSAHICLPGVSVRLKAEFVYRIRGNDSLEPLGQLLEKFDQA